MLVCSYLLTRYPDPYLGTEKDVLMLEDPCNYLWKAIDAIDTRGFIVSRAMR